MSKAISILMIIWLSVFALGTWSNAEEFILPPVSSTYSYAPPLSEAEQKRCVRLYTRATRIEQEFEQFELIFNNNSQAHVDKWNKMVEEVNLLSTRYNKECAGKAPVDKSTVDEMNKTEPVHIPAEKEKRVNLSVKSNPLSIDPDSVLLDNKWVVHDNTDEMMKKIVENAGKEEIAPTSCVLADSTSNGHFFVETKVVGARGSLSIPMMVDTGATTTMVPYSIALGIGYDKTTSKPYIVAGGGTQYFDIVKVDALHLNDLILQHQTVAVDKSGMPTSDWTSKLPVIGSAKQEQPEYGLLGMDVLKGMKITINNGTLEMCQGEN